MSNKLMEKPLYTIHNELFVQSAIMNSPESIEKPRS